MMSRQVTRTTTAIVATFEREAQLNELVESFRSAYPGLGFIVADNSVNKYPRSDVEYLAIEAGTGISDSRNAALKLVRTPYTLLVDDDHVCLPQTKLEKLITLMLDQSLDIVAGNQLEVVGDRYDFHGMYRFENGKLMHYVDVPKEEHPEWVQFDVTPNFFVARTDKLKELGWDANLRFAKEHDDFFLRAMKSNLKVSYCPEIEVLNNAQVRHHGGARGLACENLFHERWGISDKVEVRWMRTPHSRLSFYSTRNKCLIEPSEAEFRTAMSVFKARFHDFSVLNPFD